MILFKKKGLVFGVLLLIMLSCSEKQNVIPSKPNIIFIMSDDHTTQGFGIYGSRLASLNPTPNLDKIAKEGMILRIASLTIPFVHRVEQPSLQDKELKQMECWIWKVK